MSHYLPNHITITEFAKAKQVYPNSVFSAIDKGSIIPDTVGRNKLRLIDLDKYKDYAFRVYKDSNHKVEAFFQRKGKSFASQGLMSPKRGGKKYVTISLLSVHCAIDTKLITYPLTPEGLVNRSRAQRVPLANRPPGWWHQLDAQDQQTVAYLQSGEMPPSTPGPASELV